jgi:site-specific recombinase XerD
MSSIYDSVQDALDGAVAYPDKPSLDELLGAFLGQYESSETRRAYRGGIDKFLDWVGRAKQPADVEALDIVKWQKRLSESGLADTTIEKHKKSVRTFLRWCGRLGYYDPSTSPAKAIKQKRQTLKVRRDKAMTNTEFALLKNFMQWQPRNHAILEFLAKTGARAGGVATLTLSRLDLTAMQAMVIEKGRPARPVFFDEVAAEALRAWLQCRPGVPNDWLFPAGDSHLSSDAISQVIRRGCLKVQKTRGKAAIRSLGSHSLRHRLGFTLADMGVPPPVAQVVLGHANVMITLESYYPNDWQRAEDALRTAARINVEEMHAVMNRSYQMTNAEGYQKVLSFKQRSNQ